VPVSETAALQRESRQEQESLQRTSSFCEDAPSQRASEECPDAMGVAAAALSSEELLTHSAVAGPLAEVEVGKESEWVVGPAGCSCSEASAEASVPKLEVQQAEASRASASLEPEGLEEVAFEKLPFTGSAQDLLRQWEAVTRGCPRRPCCSSCSRLRSCCRRGTRRGPACWTSHLLAPF